MTLGSNPDYFATTSYVLFTLISASLNIQNFSSITQQNSLLNSFLSTTNLSDSTISDIDTIEIAIRVTSSTLNAWNMTISRVTNPNSLDLMSITLDSILSIDDLMFTDSQSNLMNVRSTVMHINNITFQNISSFTDLMRISSSTNVNISQFTSMNTTTDTNEKMLITDCSNVILDGIHTSDTTELIIDIVDSNVTSLTNLQIHNCKQGVYMQNSNILSLSNSNFTNNGNSSQRLGGAIYISQSIATIQNSSFTNNTSIDGGAIYFGCTSVSNCNLTLNNLTFSSNTAVSQGGAVYYDYVRPSFDRVEYTSNSAQYGPEIASYPVKIRLVNSTENDVNLSNVGSGIAYGQTLTFGLYDYDDQVMVLDNSDQLTISAINTQSSSISGINVGLLNQGVTSFDNLRFISAPGSTNVHYRISSKVIDSDKIQNVFGQSISDNNIYVDFRYCEPGEFITSTNQCEECSAGTYSFNWNSTQCESCLSDAVCNGGANIEVSSEYWRRTTNSTKIIK